MIDEDGLNLKQNTKGYIVNRESSNLEFKANFHLGDQLLEYCRSIAGMANNRGGSLVFGIKDNPRIPVGMTNAKFIECDPKVINSRLLDCFSHEIEWEMRSFEWDHKNFGIITVKEANQKPIICKKNLNKVLREGAIYYRYRAETKEINYPELLNIIEKERLKEKLLWMQHIEQIKKIGPQNIHILDSNKGELHLGRDKIYLDQSLLNKISFVIDGNLSRKKGSPTLKIVGNIEGIVDPLHVPPSDILYPLFESDLAEQLNLSKHVVRCIIWKLEIKNQKQYHNATKIGKKSNIVHKYSNQLIEHIKSKILDENFIFNCLEEYRNHCRDNYNRKKLS